MNPKIIFCLALVLSGGLLGRSSVAPHTTTLAAQTQIQGEVRSCRNGTLIPSVSSQLKSPSGMNRGFIPRWRPAGTRRRAG